MNKAKNKSDQERPIHGGRKLSEIRMNEMDGMLVLIISYRH